MLEQESNTEIVNKITRYKHKCDKLEDEISVLKSAIYELSQPSAFSFGLDRQVHNLQTNIEENKDINKIKKSVDLLVNAMSNLQKDHEKWPEKVIEIDPEINAKLEQLISPLIIPENLHSRLTKFKASLTKKLTLETLNPVLTNLKDLVIESFHFEHHQFKELLNKFSSCLHDFDSAKEPLTAKSLEAQAELEQLERATSECMRAIKVKVKPTKNVELMNNIDKNLKSILRQTKDFKYNELQRIRDYEDQVTSLELGFHEVAFHLRDLGQQLSSQKGRVNHDFLTDLPNRAAYEEYIFQAFNRWKRGFGEMTLAMADIDHLKN